MTRHREQRQYEREQEILNREQRLPKGLSLSDSFWHAVVQALGWTQEKIQEHCIQERVWRDSNGIVRRLGELGDRHLNNIIRMLERTEDPSKMLPHLYEEQKRRWEKQFGKGAKK
jgi:hypothetical protein